MSWEILHQIVLWAPWLFGIQAFTGYGLLALYVFMNWGKMCEITETQLKAGVEEGEFQLQHSRPRFLLEKVHWKLIQRFGRTGLVFGYIMFVSFLGFWAITDAIHNRARTEKEPV